MSIRVLVSGSSGVVGQSLLDVIASDPRFELAGQARRSSFFEADAEGDAIIDFSHPALLERTLAHAVRHRTPLVIGTTGIGAALEERIAHAAESIPICQDANFSVGVTLLKRLATVAAAVLGDDFDVEISEAHHRRKLDAPSGTALALARTVADELGRDAEANQVTDRTQHRIPRGRQEIGFQVLRGGDVVGEHTLHFLGNGERLELTHRAQDRSVFARGALRAALALCTRSPGLIQFSDLMVKNDG
jgi:4-hydroxy-tetrahydrodipicolinate reductase